MSSRHAHPKHRKPVKYVTIYISFHLQIEIEKMWNNGTILRRVPQKSKLDWKFCVPCTKDVGRVLLCRNNVGNYPLYRRRKLSRVKDWVLHYLQARLSPALSIVEAVRNIFYEWKIQFIQCQVQRTFVDWIDVEWNFAVCGEFEIEKIGGTVRQWWNSNGICI